MNDTINRSAVELLIKTFIWWHPRRKDLTRDQQRMVLAMINDKLAGWFENDVTQAEVWEIVDGVLEREEAVPGWTASEIIDREG